MRRRQFITLLGGGAATWPRAAHSQQAGNAVRIGIVPVGSASNTYDASLVEAFRAGIRQVGLDETSIDPVWVKNEDEYAQVIDDLLQRGVRVLVTAGTSASVAAKRRTSTIPIVFVAVGDPIGVELVESLSYPGGNVTGFADILLDLASKYVGSPENWISRKRQSTVFGIKTGPSAKECSVLRSRLLNHCMWSSDPEASARSPKRMIRWLR
jgi:putative ABC transport system substrate-binding protein